MFCRGTVVNPHITEFGSIALNINYPKGGGCPNKSVDLSKSKKYEEVFDLSEVKVLSLVKASMPFIGVRVLAYFLFSVVSLLIVGVVGGIIAFLYSLIPAAGTIFFLISFGVLLGTLKVIHLLKSYTIYIVKSGHIAVIVELLSEGKIKGSQLTFALGKVKSRFGSTSVAAGLNSLIHVAVKQLMRWIVRAQDFLSAIPGADILFNFVNLVLSVILNYVDESVLGYIYLKGDQDPWKSAADGIVLYFQSWKKLTVTAIVLAVVVLMVKFVLLLLTFGFATLITSQFFAGSSIMFTLNLFIAYVLAVGLQGAIVDPIITLFMLKTYLQAIEGVEPSIDLHEKVQGVSEGFREIVSKSKGAAIEIFN